MQTQSMPGSLPDPIKRLAAAGYYRYKSWEGDYSHEQPSISFNRRADATDHIVIIVIDALRPDFEPELQIPFGRAITPGTWTFPAVTSIHTGTYPHKHEAVAHTHPDDDSYIIPEQATPDITLPEAFESAGYDTYAGLAFMTPFLAIKGWYESHRVYRDTTAEQVIQGYRKWRSGREPTFSYLHLGDLHAPIEPPSNYVEQYNIDTSLQDLPQLTRYTDDYDDSNSCRRFREERLKLYQAALDYVEDILKKFVDRYSNNTTILISGDHGEAHWEHYKRDHQFTDSRPNYGVGHGGTPFDMVARVPATLHTPS